MNIQDTTRLALSELFPEQPVIETESEVEEEVPAEIAVEVKTKGVDDTVVVEEEEDLPRQNGIIAQDYSSRGFHLDVQISPDQLVRASRILFDLDYFIESITGVDWIKEEQLEVLYDYNRTDGQFCRIVVRVRVPRTEPSVPTVSAIYPGANWHERETHEFFGIKFEGHPYLVPLLLPEDADFHPLLKDFTP